MIICVVGPTGVGKTKLSEVLSKTYDACIVNADAMQVYRELNIGTAKYTKSEDLGQDHYLFDICNANDMYTVYDYQRDFRKVLDDNKRKNIIVVGGTGLYLKAGLFNYEFSERETKTYDEYSNEELYELLKSSGKLDDSIHVNNRRRMISRLNASENSHSKDELLYDNVLFIGLTTDRKTLYSKIDERVDAMIENGLLEEVETLYKKYGETKSLSTGIGYKELIMYLNKEISLEGAIDLIKQRSRKYAKRQYTWFNHQLDVKWFDVDYECFDNTIEEVKKYIDNMCN